MKFPAPLQRAALPKIASGICLVFTAGVATAQTDPAATSETTSAPAVSDTELATIPVAPPATESQPEETRQRDIQQIEEVIVTATKREQSIRDIPESITAFSGADLENQGKLNLYDYIQQSPGVTASQGASGFTRVTLRGINTDTSPYAGSPSPVGTFIGDTGFTDTYITNIIPDLSAFDLANVEVLKGPQGTLFGGSALAGAIRYELQEPVQGQWQFRGFSQYLLPKGGDAALTSGAAVNVPVSTDYNVAFRFDYVDRHFPGITDDLRSGKDNVDHASGNQVRAILSWLPTEDSKVKLTHLSQDTFAPDTLLADNPHTRNSSQDVLPEPSKTGFTFDTVELADNFDDMRATSLSSRVYKHADFTGDDTAVLFSPPPANYPASAGAPSRAIDNSRAFNQELRLQSTGNDPFQWIVGAFYSDYRIYFDIDIDTVANQSATGDTSTIAAVASALGLPPSTVNDDTALLNGVSNAHARERALFADLSYKLWDDLDLSAGARFYSTSVYGGFTGTGLLVRGENDGADSDTMSTLKQKGINPKFSATYHFDKDISLFGMAAKGFRFGGVNDVPSTSTNGVPATYKSDTIWNFELGLRTSWLDDTLHADVSVFDIQYHNPIIGQSTQGVPIGYDDNVSSAVSHGFETNLLWNTPIRGLSLSLAGGLTDAHITAAFKASNGQEINPGTEMPGAAHAQFNTSIQYLQPVSILLVGANTSYTYVGKGYNDLTHDIEINGFGTLNAGLTFASDALSFHPKLAVNVSNIANVTRPNAGAVGTAIVTQTPYGLYALNPPRELTLRLSIDF